MKISSALKLLCVSFGLFSIVACEDACKGVDCGPNGACLEGACVCNDGYVKNSDNVCVPENSGFDGDYTARDSCSITGLYTGFTVSATTQGSTVTWTNIYEAGEETTCTLSSDGRSCTVDPGQMVDGFPISGTCILEDDGSCTFEYDLEWTSTTESCVMILTK
ncbi:hypothetical protein HZ996_11755 [Cryomorphaceae bacterium]|nr:hypothetical protein HZ996_11755 [Cryomorphaceae bacterium]